MQKISFCTLLWLLYFTASAQNAKIENLRVTQDSSKVIIISYDLSQNTRNDTIKVLIIRKGGGNITNPKIDGSGVKFPSVQPEKRQIYWDYTKDMTKPQESIKIMLYINQPPQLRQGIFEKKYTKWVGLGLTALSTIAVTYTRINFIQKRRELVAFQDGVDSDKNGLTTQSQYTDLQARYEQTNAARQPVLFNTLLGTSITLFAIDAYAFWRSRKN